MGYHWSIIEWKTWWKLRREIDICHGEYISRYIGKWNTGQKSIKLYYILTHCSQVGHCSANGLLADGTEPMEPGRGIKSCISHNAVLDNRCQLRILLIVNMQITLTTKILAICWWYISENGNWRLLSHQFIQQVFSDLVKVFTKCRVYAMKCLIKCYTLCINPSDIFTLMARIIGFSY